MHGICKLGLSLRQHTSDVTYTVICDIMIMSLVPLLCLSVCYAFGLVTRQHLLPELVEGDTQRNCTFSRYLVMHT